MAKFIIKDIIKENLSPEFHGQLPDDIGEFEFNATILKDDEIRQLTNELLDKIQQNSYTKVGKHRHDIWEKGWAGDGIYKENDAPYEKLPYYSNREKIIRIKNKLYMTDTKFVQIQIIRAMQFLIIPQIMAKFSVAKLAEYGCGTGHNLHFLHKIGIKTSDLYAFDWAQSAIDGIIESGVVAPQNAQRLDYFDQATYNAPDANFLAYTNHSLEQTGNNYHDFINYLIKNPNCQGGVHFEIMNDVLFDSSESGLLSQVYSQYRHYLSGFGNFMKLNEYAKKLEILYFKPCFIGAEYCEANSILIWRKKHA